MTRAPSTITRRNTSRDGSHTGHPDDARGNRPRRQHGREDRGRDHGMTIVWVQETTRPSRPGPPPRPRAARRTSRGPSSTWEQRRRRRARPAQISGEPRSRRAPLASVAFTASRTGRGSWTRYGAVIRAARCASRYAEWPVEPAQRRPELQAAQRAQGGDRRTVRLCVLRTCRPPRLHSDARLYRVASETDSVGFSSFASSAERSPISTGRAGL